MPRGHARVRLCSSWPGVFCELLMCALCFSLFFTTRSGKSKRALRCPRSNTASAFICDCGTRAFMRVRRTPHSRKL